MEQVLGSEVVFSVLRRRGFWLGLLLWGSPAAAQQPLGAFLDAAASGSLDRATAELEAREALARRTVARSALLPRLSATAGYTRNQVEVAATFPGPEGTLESAVISAQDQLDATLRADWTLVDASAMANIRSVDAQLDAARYQAQDAQITVERAVVVAYHRLAAARHVAAAAQRSVEIAMRNEAVVESQMASGRAARLDGDRARADLARAEQQAAEAALEVALASRELTVLTNLEPTDGLIDLTVEAEALQPVETYLDNAQAHPRVRGAQAQVVAARRGERSSKLAVVPSVSAFGQERFSNSAGFGPDALWSAGVSAQWRFDAGRPAQAVEASRATQRAVVAKQRTEQAITTSIHDAWHRVRASQARLVAARAEELARSRAAEIAQSRLDTGAGSSLERSVAERDRFDAEVSRIRAEADLRTDQLSLRLVAGLPIVLKSEVTP
ncbi:MAG: TolC family protein [Myxococcota bacterium]